MTLTNDELRSNLGLKKGKTSNEILGIMNQKKPFFKTCSDVKIQLLIVSSKARSTKYV